MLVSFDFPGFETKANRRSRIAFGLHPSGAQIEEKIAAILTPIATPVMIYAR
jgi:hypothetical protein